jgi:hypothetical protein
VCDRHKSRYLQTKQLSIFLSLYFSIFAINSKKTSNMKITTAYDQQLAALPGLNWLPWIGQHYGDYKILILGDSHYYEKDKEERKWLDSKDATRGYINDHGLNSHNFPDRDFLSSVENVLLNKAEASDEDREKIWTRVAFFNLVQRPMTNGSTEPEDVDYDEGWRNFLNVVDIIKPTVCIKFGHRGIGRLGYLLQNASPEVWSRDNYLEFYKDKGVYNNEKKPYSINLTKGDYQLRIHVGQHPSGRNRNFEWSDSAHQLRISFPGIGQLLE